MSDKKDISGRVWGPEIEELHHRQALGAQMGDPDRIERHKNAGKLTVRERIDGLLDEGSFHEIGAIVGAPTYDEKGNLVNLRPSNFIMGTGRIDGRKVIRGWR